MKLYRNSNKDDNAKARELFEKVREATEPTPNATEPNKRLAARAYAGLAATYRKDWNFGWTTNDPAELRALEQRAFERAKKSVEVDPSSPYGHVQLAYLHLYQMHHDEAEKEAREAVRLGGVSFPEGYAVLAQVLTYGGEPQIAVALMEKALELDRQAPLNRRQEPVFLRQLGQAYYVMGQVEKHQKGDAPQAMEYYRKAEEYLIRASEVNRQVRLTLAAVYVEARQVPKAQALFTADQDVRCHITIGLYRQQAPYKQQVEALFTGELSMKERYINALREAESSGGTR
jgi:tetratricopeptide (TPR) repeat protein